MQPLNDNPRLGFESKNPALHPGHNVCQSTVALMLSWSVASKARQSEVMGRFMTPDSSDGPDTIPYAKYGNPQSLNLYSYAGNSPLRNIDPDGHDCIYFSGSGDASVKSGDCYSDTDNGVYVNGTINSLSYNAANSSLGFSYTAYDTGNIGTGVIAGAPAPGSGPQMDEGRVTDQSGGLLASIAGVSGAYQAFRTLTTALGAAKDPQLVPPAYANTPGGFVNWLRNLEHAGTKLTSSQADALAAQAKQLGVDVRLDPPHPGTNWDVPHLNFGREGQAHLEVPQGYSNATIPQGSATRPR